MPLAPELPPPVAEALLQSDVAALQRLGEGTDRALRKAAKRALHLLRSRGVAVEAQPAASPARTPTPALEATNEPCRVTTFDGQGDRAFFLPLKLRSGFRLAAVVASERGELIDLQRTDLSRRQVRLYFAGLPPTTRAVLREIPAWRAKVALRPVLEAAQGPHRQAAKELLAELAQVGGAPLTPPVGDDREVSASRLAESAELLATDALSDYTPEREPLLALVKKLDEVAASPLFVDEAQRAAQLQRVVEQATAEYFTPERRALFAARLRDAAELFDERPDLPNAERARAAAAALSDGRDVLAVPLARALFERLFGRTDARGASRPPMAPADSAPSARPLIVAP